MSAARAVSIFAVILVALTNTDIFPLNQSVLDKDPHGLKALAMSQ